MGNRIKDRALLSNKIRQGNVILRGQAIVAVFENGQRRGEVSGPWWALSNH
jgi:hypothetical protein